MRALAEGNARAEAEIAQVLAEAARVRAHRRCVPVPVSKTSRLCPDEPALLGTWLLFT